MKKLILIIILLGLGGGIYYVSHKDFGFGPGHGAGAMGPMPVTAAEAVSRDVLNWHGFSGRLEATDRVDVRPRVTGTIESIHFEDGAMVKKGDLLFKIDPRPFEADLKRAEADVTSAKAKITLAATDMARAARLLKEKAIPQREYDAIANNKASADAALAAADAALTVAQLNLEYTEIRAPIDGRASRAEVTVGNLVQGNPSPPLLSTIVSYSPIYASFDMDEQTYLYFNKQGAGTDGQKIQASMTLASNDSRTYTGEIHSFDNHLDPASGTVRVRAIFDNADGQLIPGLFATIHVGEPTKQKRVLVTDRAVGTDQDRKFLYVVNKDNVVEYRPVKLGPVVDGLRSIDDGLAGGEKVIVKGLQRARPGAPVMPEIISMDTANSDAPAAPADAAEKTDGKKE